MNRGLIERLPIREVDRLILDGTINASDLSPERLAQWIAWEPPPVPITSFWLGDEGGCRGFLWECSWQGETIFFAAVAHIWDSLEGHRDAHFIKIGALSGTGGKGKTALLLTLQQHLRECLDFNPTLPRREDYADLESWNAACHQHWHDDEAHMRGLCARYLAILDGCESIPDDPPDTETASVIAGPWRAFPGTEG